MATPTRCRDPLEDHQQSVEQSGRSGGRRDATGRPAAPPDAGGAGPSRPSRHERLRQRGPAALSQRLYHCSKPEARESIKANGLLPMGHDLLLVWPTLKAAQVYRVGLNASGWADHLELRGRVARVAVTDHASRSDVERPRPGRAARRPQTRIRGALDRSGERTCFAEPAPITAARGGSSRGRPADQTVGGCFGNDRCESR